MRMIERGLIVVLLALVIVQAVASQADRWQFVAERPVVVHEARDLDSRLVRTVGIGEIVTIMGPYVYADELIWATLPQWGYIAVARYGVCEIRSFGTYPQGREPVSVE